MKNLFKIIFVSTILFISSKTQAQYSDCEFTLMPDSSCIRVGQWYSPISGALDTLWRVGGNRPYNLKQSYFRFYVSNFIVDYWKTKYTGSLTKYKMIVVDTTTGIVQSVDIPKSSSVSTTNVSAYSVGTVYSLTTTSQKLTFGTTSPSVTLPSPGTYLIISNLTVGYSGLTNLVVNTCNFKLRRTNNTAADLSNTSTSFDVPVVTLLTQTAGDADINTILYTTTNSNDVIEMWGNRTGGVTAGSVNVNQAYILAIKQY